MIESNTKLHDLLSNPSITLVYASRKHNKHLHVIRVPMLLNGEPELPSVHGVNDTQGSTQLAVTESQ